MTRTASSGDARLDISIEDFNELGFALGDSLNVNFSNGYTLEDVPYYSGKYPSEGNVLVVGDSDDSHVKIIEKHGDGLWSQAGLSEGDTATIARAKSGKYLNVQEAYSISYTNDRADYASDEVFANFRSLSGGSIKSGRFYRSASPVDNEHNRAAWANALMRDAGVRFVLDLSDSADKVDKRFSEDDAAGIDVSYFKELYESGNVVTIGLTSDYRSDKFATKLAGGLIELLQHEGPYLTHCIEGKDRTGFVCVLIEACAGATYKEILADYMRTYENYYGITEQGNPVKYDAISSVHLHAMLRYLAGVDESADLTTIDYTEPARAYLRSGGMTDEQIDALLERICK